MKLDQLGIIPSMSKVGKCTDNGPMEGFWGIIKSEMYYQEKFYYMGSLSNAIDDYIDYYNNKRFQEKIKGLTPVEYRNQAVFA
ncbi:MAG TPA: IS3 family transposase [Bacilli bacterium]|nr:IS3 family transposase [Bacilli bacterium]